MLRIHVVDFQCGQIEIFQNTQCDQGCNALAIRWYFVKFVTAVVLGNGCDPFGFVILEVFSGKAAAMRFRKLFNRMRNFTAIKRLAFAFGNRA